MPTDTSDTPAMVQHAAHGGGVRIALAQVAVAQVGMGVELQHHEVLMARRERADGAGGQRMLAAQHERKFAGRQHRLDDARELVERRLDRPRDRGLAQRRHAVVEIGLAPQLLVVELELLAGRQDGRRPRRRAAAVADRGLQAERDDHGPRGRRVVGIRADGIEKALLGRQIIELGAHAWTCCASRLLSPGLGSPYIVSIGSSSRIASSKAP